ncbi:MAG: protein kinase, partial [SAR202 cluster bacterium]|nr:protein kinase [SAR202 cluster bacterium]
KRFLGEGGKKIVYLAQDTLLDRDVAFALIKTDGLDEVSRTRISREAQAMGRLGSHPHIVTVFDLGDHEGQPFMVVELLGGGDVEGVLEDADGERLPLEQAISIAIETCRGLEFAHSRGIIHRDLKPGNVWLTDDGVAKIGDFGLAVSLDRSRLTAEGMMVGTVSYMPPEQAMGGEVTPRADLYSLGAMLYEMVCGRPPFLGDDNIAIIGQHINTPPVAPTWHNSQCPPALETLIMRLLEKDVSKRPESAGEALNILESINVDHAPTLTEPSIESPAQPEGQNPIYRHTFVGREVEVRQLQIAFDSTLSGEGSLVMVVGEPGIGKTTITEQLATYVTLRGGKTLVGHCYEEGSLSLPYLPFVEAMRSYVLERDTEDLKRELGSGATDVARIVSEIRDRVDIEPRESGDAEQDHYRLLQGVTDFLRNASSVQPLLIVLEDLHDADRGTLDMLAHISRNQSGARLMIVGTYRDVEVDRSHPLSGTLADLRRLSNFSRVLLRGLSADEVQRMLSLVAEQDVPWGLSEAVHRQTEGNPLFVQEVVRYLVEEGLIAREGGQWQNSGDISLTMSIPEGLRDVIGKRLSRLSDECNRVLSVAAVIGREFRMDVLGQVADVSEDELFSTLEEAQGAAVIEERSSAGGIVSFWFTHAFFRQTLYEETFTPRRIRLHRQVGEALEDVYSSRLAEHASEMAEHFSNSSDAEGLRKALAYGEMAADRAMSVYAYGEAARLLEQATEVQDVLDPDDVKKRCELLLSLGSAMMPLGQPRRVLESVAPEALEIAESLDESDLASRVCKQALEALNSYGAATIFGSDDARRWAERSDKYAIDGSADRVHADLALARICHQQGNFVEANSYVRRALATAQSVGQPDVLFQATFEAITSAGSSLRFDERLGLAKDFTQRSRHGVTVRNQAEVLWHSIQTYLDNGFRDRAESLYREALELSERTGDGYLLLHKYLYANHLAVIDGETERAIDAGEQMIAISEELGAPVAGLQFSSVSTRRPLLYLGRPATIVETASLTTEQNQKDTMAIMQPLINLALGFAHMGRSAEANEALNRIMPVFDLGSPGDAAPIAYVVPMLEAATLSGNKAASKSLASWTSAVSHLVIGHTSMTCVARQLGAAAVLLDDQTKAREYYELALEVTAKIRFRPEMALTRLQLAELLLEHYPDERAEAIQHLDLAIPEFRDMKMQPSLERALSHRDILKA